jgi:hypothetical protein
MTTVRSWSGLSTRSFNRISAVAFAQHRDRRSGRLRSARLGPSKPQCLRFQSQDLSSSFSAQWQQTSWARLWACWAGNYSGRQHRCPLPFRQRPTSGRPASPRDEVAAAAAVQLRAAGGMKGGGTLIFPSSFGPRPSRPPGGRTRTLGSGLHRLRPKRSAGMPRICGHAS